MTIIIYTSSLLMVYHTVLAEYHIHMMCYDIQDLWWLPLITVHKMVQRIYLTKNLKLFFKDINNNNNILYL